MPRRRREDLLGAVQLVRRSGRLDGWEIVLIDGMTQQQVAEELGRAAIFLFGAEREGVGLPGAEAMASGCYVVGFTGDGAKEYMLPEHSSVIADSDVVGMCDRTLEAMEWFDQDRATFDARARAGREWVRSRHSAELVRERLGDGVRARSPRRARRRCCLRPPRFAHYQSHAPASDPYNRAPDRGTQSGPAGARRPQQGELTCREESWPWRWHASPCCSPSAVPCRGGASRCRTTSHGDLDIYIRAIERMDAGASIYDWVNDFGMGYTYPPIAAALMAPLTWASQALVTKIWLAASIAAAALLVVLLRVVSGQDGKVNLGTGHHGGLDRSLPRHVDSPGQPDLGSGQPVPGGPARAGSREALASAPSRASSSALLRRSS